MPGSLVERESELRAFDAALAGPGRVVLVSGEAGIGKTTLVRAFAERAGRRVAFALCERVSASTPLAPFDDLEELVGAMPADAPAAARALLGALRREPAVVVFEDAHWADTLTLDALEIAGRRIGTTRSVLVVTFRDDEEAEGVRALAGGIGADALRLRPPRSAARPSRGSPGRPDVDPATAVRGDGRQSVPRDRVDRRRRRAYPRRSATRRSRATRLLGADARGVLDVLAVYGESMPLALLAELCA